MSIQASLKLLLICAALASTASQDVSRNQIASNDDNGHLNQAVSNILIPRVVGTPGHEKVFQYIKRELETLNFHVEIDEFSDRTPNFGNLTFSNIIAKSNPDADQFLTLACHYDSKYFANNPKFIGAIDSAVPCAIMLNIARTLQPQLKADISSRSDIGLMLIFFDGEEAFVDWNQYDSVYGSRHLADEMSRNTFRLRGSNDVVRDIDRIEVLVLLDLIGAANQKFRSFYQNTATLHKALYNYERSLAKSGLLEGSSYQVLQGPAYGSVDDDHRPFLQRNVPVLHLINTPFPKQWHKATDTAANLDWPTIRNFNRILRVFTYEYLKNHSEKFNFRV